MKKIKNLVLLLIVAILLMASVSSSSGLAKAECLANNYILKGLVISGIPSSDLVSKTNGPVFIGLEKVDNAYDLKYSESFDSSNSIPLFSRVDLFSSQFIGKNTFTIQDLKKMYKSLPEGDNFDRERIIATINSLYIDEKGNPLITSQKVGSEIQITYKKISTGRGSSLIPIRNVKESNKIKTIFLLNPYAIPENERLNKFDFEYAYDIKPVFFNTIALREKGESSRIDFSGFYIDIPDLSNKKFINVVEKSLKRFSKFVHSKRKLLIIENLNKDNYYLGQYADIIGIQYSEDLQFLESVRKAFPNKVIFARIDRDFSQSNIQKILQNLSLFGIYPEFARDLKTGDFLYYEPQFQQDLSTINLYLNGIITENGLTFKKFYTKDGFEISEFSDDKSIMYFVKGKGICSLHPNVPDITQYSDLSGKQFILQSGNINVPINSDTFIIGHRADSPIQFLGILPESQNGIINVLFQNFANKNQSANITITANGRTVLNESNNKFLSHSHKILSVNFKSGNLSVFINHNNVFNLTVKKDFNVSLYLFLTLFFLLTLLWLYAGKIAMQLKKSIISIKALLLLLFIGGFGLVILNSYVIHYSSRVFLFLLFGAYFIFLALYDYAFSKDALRWAVIFFAFGSAINFLQYGTIGPKFFYGIMPYQRFDWVLFIAPWVLLLAAFSTYGNKKFVKLEVILIILALAGPVFFFTPNINPMVLNLTLANSYPLAIMVIGGGFLAVLHKKGFAPYLILLFVITALYFGSVYASNVFYSRFIFSHSTLVKLLVLKDIFLFIAPFYFVALLHHNIAKTNPKVSINKFVITFVFIVVLAALYSMWGFNVHCSTTIERVFAMPAYILIEFLLSMILIHPLNGHTEV